MQQTYSGRVQRNEEFGYNTGICAVGEVKLKENFLKRSWQS